MYALAEASYGNTAGDGNMRNLSLQLLQEFERHWSENEIESDTLPRGGMGRLITTLIDQLSASQNVTLKLAAPVQHVNPTSDGIVSVSFVSDEEKTLDADAAVITVPPALLASVVDLSPAKLEALSHVSLVRVVKVFAKFCRRLWPAQLQNIVCSACPLPEVWFDEESSNDEGAFKLTGFLTSRAAALFMDHVAKSDGSIDHDKVAEVIVQQLSRVFQLPILDVRKCIVETYVHDWLQEPYIQGGYLCPKVGLTLDHLATLAEPLGSVFFAGEATHTQAACTVHAAVETGYRAAQQVTEHLQLSR